MNDLLPTPIRYHGETYWPLEVDPDGYQGYLTIQHTETGDLHTIYRDNPHYQNIVAQIEAQRIFQAILRERAYQDRKYGTIQDRNLTLDDYIVILSDELCEAGISIRTDDFDNARCELLQVAAIAIAALEAHGLVERHNLTPIPSPQSPITSTHNKRL